MSWHRATSLAAVVLIGGLGLTACGGNGSDTKGSDKPATASAAPGTADAGTPSDAPGTSGGVKEPEDLPAGLPLPDGTLTTVTGDKGAYVLTYRSDDPKALIADYRTALEGASYTVVDIAGVFTATSDKTSVSIATSGNDVILTVASM
ncbi:hypothetical protein [Streptomyces sp. NPDC101115]|uniref:hypothetical protein n=1 Tax=Streptomyces sp. NPDC101115 TaxID=3366106 RepID=UPI0037F29FFC